VTTTTRLFGEGGRGYNGIWVHVGGIAVNVMAGTPAPDLVERSGGRVRQAACMTFGGAAARKHIVFGEPCRFCDSEEVGLFGTV